MNITWNRIVTDLRLVIGFFFVVIGIVLLAVTISPLRSETNGVCLQLWSGISLTSFGLLMLILGFSDKGEIDTSQLA